MIQVRDETAATLLITIDNNGNMAFGNGTPINRLTLDGYGLIDDQGNITYGVVSGSFGEVAGSANAGIFQATTILTQSGRIPTVQINTTYPAHQYYWDGTMERTLPINQPEHIVEAGMSQFFVQNRNSTDANVGPSGPHEDPTLATAPFIYRWI
jgi:hypothetical protein